MAVMITHQLLLPETWCCASEVIRTAAPPFSTLSMPGLAGAAVAGADSAYSL